MYAHVSLFVCFFLSFFLSLRGMWLSCSWQWGLTGRVKWNECVRTVSWAHLKYYYGICQEVGLLKKKKKKNSKNLSRILNIIRSLNCPGIQYRNITGRTTLLCAHMHKDDRIFTHINWMNPRAHCSVQHIWPLILNLCPTPFPKRKRNKQIFDYFL
jgi:hypothetical protein